MLPPSRTPTPPNDLALCERHCDDLAIGFPLKPGAATETKEGK